MSAPFEKFTVRRRLFTCYFTVEITVPSGTKLADTKPDYEITDWRTDVRRFIEDAIREKLAKESRDGH